MRIAVLGAGSFSGAAFVAHAEACGYDVLQLLRPRHDVNVGIQEIMRDVSDWRPTHFVNFAALNMVGESWEYASDYYLTNVIGISRLADRLQRWGKLRKFVQVSTPEVYGATGTFLAEDAPFNPSTPYAVSRAAADMHLRALHRLNGFPVCFTRTVNVYGPGQQAYRIIPKTVLKIARGERLKLHGGGVSTRAFIHIRDVAEAILRVARGGEPGHSYHISHPIQISIRDLVAKICHGMGAAFEEAVEDDAERPGKDMAYQLCDQKIRAELDFTSRIPLGLGLSETVAWFRARAGEYAGRSLEYEHRP